MLSFGLFFGPGMAAEPAHAARQTLPEALSTEGELGGRLQGFAEHLRPADGWLGAELTRLRDAVRAGRGESLGEAGDEAWLEERLQSLLWRMLEAEPGWRGRSQALAGLSRSQHAELLARVDSATDLMLSDPGLSLDEVAARSGLGSRQTLFRQLRRQGGAGGQALQARLAAEPGHLHL